MDKSQKIIFQPSFLIPRQNMEDLPVPLPAAQLPIRAVTSKSDLTSAYSLTDHNPYCYSPVSFAHRVAQRLLEGEESVLGLFASNPFPEKAPAFVRVTGYGLSPCSIAHHQKTGNWWHAQQLCEVVPSRQTDPSIWQRWVPHAECFHPEHDTCPATLEPTWNLLRCTIIAMQLNFKLCLAAAAAAMAARMAPWAFAPAGFQVQSQSMSRPSLTASAHSEGRAGTFAMAGAAAAGLALGAAAAAGRSARASAMARRSHAVKIYDTCIGCTLCVRACPTDVLEMVPATINAAKQVASSPRVEDCVGCKRCETACPTDFLSIRVYLQECKEVWRSRSGPVQALRASDPSDVDAAVFCEGIGKDEVAAFWSEFIPSVQRARGDWISLPSRARELAERTAPAKLALYERILARYVLLLLRQVSPQLVQQIGIAILFGTWRLHLLLHDVVAEGKDAYLDTLKNPESLLPRAEKIQDPQLLDLLGLLRPADLQFEDCKFHYHYAAKQRPDRRGFLKSICEFDYGGMYSFVKFMAQQPSLSPLWLPKAELLNSGAWIVEGYQDQGEATASTSLSAPLVRRRASSEDSRRCERHKRVLFVKTVVGGKIDKTVEIPYGHCEVGLWYRCRAHEATGLSIRQMKLLFAGAPLPDDRRHSGLQVGSTLHLVVPAQEPRA
eukprot:s307_g16.t2